jgi:uncharacterized protein YjbJ (UPF0337 family)
VTYEEDRMDMDDLKNKAKHAWEEAEDAVTGAADDRRLADRDFADDTKDAVGEAADSVDSHDGGLSEHAEGVKDDIVGHVKEAAGDWTDNPSLEAEGQAQQREADAHHAEGRAEDL